MGLMYVGAALVIILMHADQIGWAFGQIFEGAFTGLGVAGGFVGALIQGFRPCGVLQRGGCRLGGHRALRGQDQGADHRRRGCRCWSR